LGLSGRLPYARGGPFFRGLTVPVVALVLFTCCEKPKWRAPASPEFRWPLAAIQVLFAFTYLSSGLTKLLAVGPRWFTARNFQGLVLGLIFPEVAPPWSRLVAASAALCQAGVFAAIFLDFVLVLLAFSPRLARIAVPILVAGHLLVIEVMGVVFLGLPLLLLFVNWGALARRAEKILLAVAPRKAPGILNVWEAGPEPPRSLRR